MFEYGAHSALTLPALRLCETPQALHCDTCRAPVPILQATLLLTFVEDDSLSSLIGTYRWKVVFV